MIGLMCLKDSILIKPMVCMGVLFVMIEIHFKFQPEVWHVCHDLMQKSMSFNNAAIVSVTGNYCRIMMKSLYPWVKMKSQMC